MTQSAQGRRKKIYTDRGGALRASSPRSGLSLHRDLYLSCFLNDSHQLVAEDGAIKTAIDDVRMEGKGGKLRRGDERSDE